MKISTIFPYFISENIFIHTKLMFLFIAFSIYSFSLQAQAKRTLTKSEEKIIRDKAYDLIRSLEDDYNSFLFSTSRERPKLIENLADPFIEARKFVNDSVIIENDFFIDEIPNLRPDQRDYIVKNYFLEISRNFGESDNGENPNPDKKVRLLNPGFKKIMQKSPQDSLSLKATFDVYYDGVARNGFAFRSPQKRTALLQIEKEKKAWKVYIKKIAFWDPILDNDNTYDIKIISDNTESAQIFDYYNPEVVKAPQKTISLKPLLKKFNIDEKWGLLKDDDNDKRILVQPSFCEIGMFSEEEGLAPVCQDGVGLWGYINKEGKLVIPFQYSKANDFRKGKAKVELGMKKLTIDTSGKEIK